MEPVLRSFPGTSAPPSRRSLGVPGFAWVALVLLAAVIAIRWPAFGSPTAGLDEQFYLLVGDRIWQGAVPYTDIWDRKPAGLFLIYAAIRALPGDGVLAYQIVATLCLVATGCVAARIARRGVAPLPACAAGLAAVIYGAWMGEGFGEAPVFYDLLIAAAAWCILAARTRPTSLDRRAIAAMLLCGTALTIKTVAIFECVAFGLLLLNADRALPPIVRARRALLYMALGLLPTLAIAGFYAARGEFQIFWFANFQSIFLKSGGFDRASLDGLLAVALLVAPLLIAAYLAIRSGRCGDRAVLIAWFAGALAGYLAIGGFHFHYALPMLTPLAILAAYALSPRAAGIGIAAMIAAGLWFRPPGDAATDRAQVASLAAAIPAEARSGCLFVYEGPSILYHLTGACLPGRYVFPGHFTSPAERSALERPSESLLAETLARRPAAILSVPALRDGAAATVNDRLLAATLARHYRPVAVRDVRLYGSRNVRAVVWARTAPGGA